MKVQVSIPDELLKKIDAHTTENYLTRSGFLVLATTQYLSSLEVSTAIKSMAISMRKIADNGVVDESTMSKLEDFERLAKMFAEA